jgi:hypothetical protein
MNMSIHYYYAIVKEIIIIGYAINALQIIPLAFPHSIVLIVIIIYVKNA